MLFFELIGDLSCCVGKFVFESWMFPKFHLWMINWQQKQIQTQKEAEQNRQGKGDTIVGMSA
jgi:hypothetical protein